MLCSRGGDSMLARIGVVKALNRHVERVFNPDAKERMGSESSSGISDLASLSPGWSSSRTALKLDAALASNAGLFDSDHLTAHKRQLVCDAAIADQGEYLRPADGCTAVFIAMHDRIALLQAGDFG